MIIRDAIVDTLHTLVNMGNILFVVATVLGLKITVEHKLFQLICYDSFHLFSHSTGSSIYGLPGPWCVKFLFSERHESPLAVSITLMHTQ